MTFSEATASFSVFGVPQGIVLGHLMFNPLLIIDIPVNIIILCLYFIYLWLKPWSHGNLLSVWLTDKLIKLLN